MEEEEGSLQSGPKRSPARLAEARAVAQMRSVFTLSAVAGALATLALLPLSFPTALALAWGSLCGIVNFWVVGLSAGRLLDRGGSGLFVGAALARLAGFAFAPLALLAVAPAWTLALYYCTFLLPFGMNLIVIARDHATESRR